MQTDFPMFSNSTLSISVICSLWPFMCPTARFARASLAKTLVKQHLQGNQQRIARMDVIDLTSEDGAELERRQRAKIMAHAQQQLKQIVSGPATVSNLRLAAEQVVLDANDGGDDEQRHTPFKRLRTSHSTHSSKQDMPTAEAGSVFPPPPANPLNDLLKALHQERIARQQSKQNQPGQGALSNDINSFKTPTKQSDNTPAQTPSTDPQTPTSSKRARHQTIAEQEMVSNPPAGQPLITVLTYNLWFEEGVALRERMKGLADLIAKFDPDVLLFQEVTANMMHTWAVEHKWLLQKYKWSPPPPMSTYFTLLAYKDATLTNISSMRRAEFDNSDMGRDVLFVPLALKGIPDAPALLIATSHLESPLGFKKPNNKQREVQLRKAMALLQQSATEVQSTLKRPVADIIWGGDMNWISSQAEPQLPAGWQDVWQETHPGQSGITYDTRGNSMIKGLPYAPSRLDRFFSNLSEWQVHSLQVKGTTPLPGVTTSYRDKTVQVLISDHYGLLLKLTCPLSTQQ